MSNPTLQHELHKREPFASPEQEAFLNVQRSAAILAGPFERLFKSRGITGASYNVLRILRGAGAGGRQCHEIGEHMVAQVPDVTRLIDRLERAGLVTRSRCDKDRRVIHVRVTADGLALLAALDGPLLEMHREQLGHLSSAELAQLNRILVKARQFKDEASAPPRAELPKPRPSAAPRPRGRKRSKG